MKTSRETDGKKRLKLNIYMRRKLTIAFGIASAVLFALALYLVFMIRDNGENYQKKILTQQDYSSTPVPFRRGSIVDRNGTVLAFSEEVYNLILDPSVILYSPKNDGSQPNRKATVDTLCAALELNREEVEKTLDENPDSRYIRLVRQLSAAQKESFEKAKESYNTAENSEGKPLHSDTVTGVWFETEYKRTYPEKTLAATVQGFSGADATEGHWGIEESYNEYLSGIDGKSYSFMNQNGEREQVLQPAENGHTVVSTLDWYIQNVVEKHIKAYIENPEHEYKNVGVVVMDPANAEILAMATDKSFDPNEPMNMDYTFSAKEQALMSEEEKSVARNQMWRNFTISDANSPGSVSKEFTVAMGLEEAVVTPQTQFICDGGEEINGVFIGCTEEHGTLLLEEGLWWSCNDMMMNIAGRLSVPAMLRYQRNLGLGARTGVDLPGEATGFIFTEETMSAVDMATSSFGQGYSATMLQMAAAYCALVNGGYYFQPRIARQVVDENGALVKKIEAELVKTVVTEDTSAFIRMAAFNTVESWSTASVGHIDGYKIGGKTSTAQKYPIEENRYFIAYIAFVPADDPQLLVFAAVDEPEVDETGSANNREVVILEREIMREILPYLGIPQTEKPWEGR
ncbi:MAG: penicillin-binding protein 2 [Lachnospiraceae bacterium]|nr:penicillin-binding protein 2 [Lachnospiraceae bacterium]